MVLVDQYLIRGTQKGYRIGNVTRRRHLHVWGHGQLRQVNKQQRQEQHLSSFRLWDLRSPTCSGIMNVQGKPVLAFDPEGESTNLKQAFVNFVNLLRFGLCGWRSI